MKCFSVSIFLKFFQIASFTLSFMFIFSEGFHSEFASSIKVQRFLFYKAFSLFIFLFNLLFLKVFCTLWFKKLIKVFLEILYFLLTSHLFVYSFWVQSLKRLNGLLFFKVYLFREPWTFLFSKWRWGFCIPRFSWCMPHFLLIAQKQASYHGFCKKRMNNSFLARAGIDWIGNFLFLYFFFLFLGSPLQGLYQFFWILSSFFLLFFFYFFFYFFEQIKTKFIEYLIFWKREYLCKSQKEKKHCQIRTFDEKFIIETYWQFLLFFQFFPSLFSSFAGKKKAVRSFASFFPKEKRSNSDGTFLTKSKFDKVKKSAKKKRSKKKKESSQ